MTKLVFLTLPPGGAGAPLTSVQLLVALIVSIRVRLARVQRRVHEISRVEARVQRPIILHEYPEEDQEEELWKRSVRV